MAAAATAERLEQVWHEPPGLVSFLTTVEHTRIGIRYMVTAGIFFLLGGLEAVAVRTQLVVPNGELIGPETYNQLFTMHGFTMIFLFATPMLAGFGNYLVPIMIGARDMAFPRVNAFSYWTFLAAGLFVYASFFTGDTPDAGWFNYVPIAAQQYDPGPGIDFYNLGLIFLAIAATSGAINFIVTMMRLRAPGMSINRMPIFCWAVLVQSFALIFALPALTGANLMLELQRTFGWPFFEVEHGGNPILWQHLFWIFGHPDVYIIVLPALGIVSAIIPVFSQRRMLAYDWVIFATVATGIIGFGVWLHHMFALGLPMISLAFFAAVSMTITIPSGIQFFAWLGTMLGGRPQLKTPMLYVVGFLVVFVIGGVTGVMFAAIPFDQQVTDSYFVVAHFHYVLFGGAVFPIIAGLFHWLPKMSGRMYPERLGQLSFWLVFVGFNVTFFPMHVSGLLGMPRRVYTYLGGLGWDAYNLLSTLGSYLLGIGILAVVAAVVLTLLRGRPAGGDPWGGDTLEWATTSPPADYTFAVIPTVTSAHPNWDRGDRAADRAREERGEHALADGHQQVGTSVMEGERDAVFQMPESSIWPIATTLSLTVLFTGLVTKLWVPAIVGATLVIAALTGWHARTPAPRSASLAWWGMVWVVATELTLFGVLLSSYFWIRWQTDGGWPPQGLPDPKLLYPSLLTAAMAASAPAMWLAQRGVRRGRGGVLSAGLLATLVLGGAYLALQVLDYLEKAKAYTGQDHAYGALVFTITGAHAAHAVLGMLLVTWVQIRAWRGAYSPARHIGVTVASLYWYFVVAVAVAIYACVSLSPYL